MKKVWFIIALVAHLLWAEYAMANNSGTCGDNVSWFLDDYGTLTITGNGAIQNFYQYGQVPWFLEKKGFKK